MDKVHRVVLNEVEDWRAEVLESEKGDSRSESGSVAERGQRGEKHIPTV